MGAISLNSAISALNPLNIINGSKKATYFYGALAIIALIGTIYKISNASRPNPIQTRHSVSTPKKSTAQKLLVLAIAVSIVGTCWWVGAKLIDRFNPSGVVPYPFNHDVDVQNLPKTEPWENNF